MGVAFGLEQGILWSVIPVVEFFHKPRRRNLPDIPGKGKHRRNCRVPTVSGGGPPRMIMARYPPNQGCGVNLRLCH